MPKKELTEKQIKKLIKKLKDKKKKKRKTKKDALISQKVTQKVIIGGSTKPEQNAGRSFPQIQFLPQPQTQNMDTQLIRDLLIRNNSSPLTREVTSRVPYRPNYDLADQYGLNNNYNPYVGIIRAIPQPDPQPEPQPDPQPDPQDYFAYDNEIETPIPKNQNMLNSAEQRRQQDDLYKNYIKEEGQRRQEQFEKEEEKIQQTEFNTLKPPPQKQSTLDRPLKDPKQPNLGRSDIRDYFNTFIPSSSQKENTKLSEDVFDTLPSQEKEDFIDPRTFLDDLIKEKPRGRPPGSKNKAKNSEM